MTKKADEKCNEEEETVVFLSLCEDVDKTLVC